MITQKRRKRNILGTTPGDSLSLGFSQERRFRRNRGKSQVFLRAIFPP
jgi:hypothetical protein